MTASQKLQIRGSEIRQRLNAIAAMAADEVTDEIRAESDTLARRAQHRRVAAPRRHRRRERRDRCRTCRRRHRRRGGCGVPGVGEPCERARVRRQRDGEFPIVHATVPVRHRRRRGGAEPGARARAGSVSAALARTERSGAPRRDRHRYRDQAEALDRSSVRRHGRRVTSAS